MMKNIIDMLQRDNFYGVSKEVDRAKGMYSIPYRWSDGWKQLIRIWKSK